MLALELLDRFYEHTSAQLLLLQNYRGSRVPKFRGAGGRKRFTVHGVACLRIWGVVPTVSDMKEWDVNGYSCMGMTAPTRAPIPTRQTPNMGKHHSRGRPTTDMRRMWILLGGEDVNPNREKAFRGRAPLLRAAENGNEGILKVLMERKDIHTAIPDNKN